jgi:pyrimidine operon attenuation protein/uracil phosphoribosyltransferase
MPQVMTGDDIHRALRRISHEILETHRGADEIVIIGVHTRGVHLAQELADTIGEFENCVIPIGELDIGLYRDDRASRSDIGRKPTHIPFGIEGRSVVIVDDVLYTGRTVRAALDALTDVGRAVSTELAVLVDRGHRELPIRADYVGKNLPTSTNERVRVRVHDVDGEDGVWIEREHSP